MFEEERVTAWVLPRGQVWVEGYLLAEPVGIRVGCTGTGFQGYRSTQLALGKFSERLLRCRAGSGLSQLPGLRLGLLALGSLSAAGAWDPHMPAEVKVGGWGPLGGGPRD